MSAPDSVASPDGKGQQKPRDLLNDFTPHYYAHVIPPVRAIPLAVINAVLRGTDVESPQSARFHAFTFFGFGERLTTHSVKKKKKVLVMVTYESLVVLEADTGEVVRRIRVVDMEPPLCYVLNPPLLHVKVRNEHDFIVTFVPYHPDQISSSVDELVDMLNLLYKALVREEEAAGGYGSEGLPHDLGIEEIPTAAQLRQVQLVRPAHLSHPRYSLKQLLRFENPATQELEEQLPDDVRQMIPTTISEFPMRDRTLEDALPPMRQEDLEAACRRLELREEELTRELGAMTHANDAMRSSVTTMNRAVLELKAALQQARLEEAKYHEEMQRLHPGGAPAPASAAGNRQQHMSSAWDDEEEGEDPPMDFNNPNGGGMDWGGEEEEDSELTRMLKESGADKTPQKDGAIIRAGFEDANVAVSHEMRLLSKRLVISRLKLIEAEEQAARALERLECSRIRIADYEQVLLTLECIGEETSRKEAMAAARVVDLTLANRNLRVQLEQEKLNVLPKNLDKRLVEAHLNLVKQQKGISDEVREREKLALAEEEELRMARIANSVHLAELRSFLEADLARSAAETTIGFQEVQGLLRMHASPDAARNEEQHTIAQRAAHSVLQKVSQQIADVALLRRQLQERSELLPRRTMTLRDENTAMTSLLEDLSQEYGTSLVLVDDLTKKLAEAQSKLEDERKARADALLYRRNQLTAASEAVLAKKDAEIDKARRSLQEMQGVLQRAARAFGLGDSNNHNNTSQAHVSTTPNGSNSMQAGGGAYSPSPLARYASASSPSPASGTYPTPGYDRLGAY